MPLLSELSNIYIGSDELQYVYLGDQELGANRVPVTVPPTKYLTFMCERGNSIDSNTISLSNFGDNKPVMYYSFDRENGFLGRYDSLTFDDFDRVYIAGNNPNGMNSSLNKYSKFVISGNSKVYCSGDIMSLINPYEDVTIIPSDFCFCNLFRDCTLLCGNAPELPATTLKDNCYHYMFYHCTNLKKASTLPATTLKTSCYFHMFENCSQLTTAPELPATTLANSCYSNMFNGCTSLITAPELPITTLDYYCYSQMFKDCISLEIAPELPATTLKTGCYMGMFRGCISLTMAPELLATKLKSDCYLNMFDGCSNLNYVKCLATEISSSTAVTNGLKNVSSTGTFVKDPNMNDWPSGASGIPVGWTVRNTDNY